MNHYFANPELRKIIDNCYIARTEGAFQVGSLEMSLRMFEGPFKNKEVYKTWNGGSFWLRNSIFESQVIELEPYQKASAVTKAFVNYGSLERIRLSDFCLPSYK